MSDSQPIGTTPGGDTSGLILEYLTTSTARNAAEAEAISRAYDKHIFRARRKKRGAEWLTDDFIRKVHFDMFGAIWEWGGKYRKTRLNVGIEPLAIREQIRLLSGDFLSWDDSNSTMPEVEVAARLQHRLTKIHPFINGNGRHARLITDIFFYSCQRRLPQWPQIQLLLHGNDVRERYIAAMKKADEDDLTALKTCIEECVSESS
ncbi:mobile mystery protein B [Nitrospira sp. M1]